MKKTLWNLLIACLLVCACLLVLASCGTEPEISTGNDTLENRPGNVTGSNQGNTENNGENNNQNGSTPGGGEENTDPCADGHTEAIDWGCEPTCEGIGLTDGKHCYVCNKVLVEQTEIPAKGHAWGDWVVTTPAGCEEKGEETKTCTVCATTKTQKIAATGHKWGEFEELFPATCTEDGINGRRCAICEEMNKQTVPSKGHSWGAWVVTTPAVGNTDGVETRTCSACKATETQKIPATGHSFGAWVVTTPAGCETKGVETRTCSACGTSETRDISAKGHTEVRDAPVAPTCTTAGKTEGKHCSTCGKVLVAQSSVAALGHSFGEWTVTKQPTETTKGEKRRDCVKCDAFETDVVAELAHDHSKWDQTTLAAKEATCTESGLTEGKKCSGCGEILVTQQTIPATGHSYGAWEVTTPATCEGKGEEVKICSACQDRQTKEIPATGHSYGEWEVTTPATCEGKGERSKTCSACSKKETEPIAATGHNYVNRVCTLCGNVLYSTGLVFSSNRDGTCSVNGLGTCRDEHIIVPPTSPEGWKVTTILGMEGIHVSIRSITLPESVTKIGKTAFFNNIYLEWITIPSTVTSIGERAFAGCQSLTNFIVAEENTVYHSAGNCLIETASKTVIAGSKASVIPTDGSVTSIGNYAFESCRTLESITIPSCVTSIGAGAFCDCSGLKSITMEEGLLTIQGAAFQKCISLTSITIPKSVTSISGCLFNSCRKLESIVVVAGNPYYHSTGNCLIETETKTLIDGCMNSVIPMDGSVAIIGTAAFLETAIKEVVIPKSVVTICNRAFGGCTQLERVTFEENSNLKTFENGAFQDCNKLTDIKIPSSVTSIGSSVFPQSLIHREGELYYVDNWVIDCDTSATEIVLRDTTEGLAKDAFSGCSKLTSIELPDSVRGIGDWAFYNCSSLVSIRIPNGVTTIGDRTFYGCSKLTDVILPENLTYIGAWGFTDCKSLKSIVIPKTVTGFGEMAFSSCSAMESITFQETIAEWNALSKGPGWSPPYAAPIKTVICSDGNTPLRG